MRYVISVGTTTKFWNFDKFWSTWFHFTFHSFWSWMIVNSNKGVKGHTNFGNHIETGSSNKSDTTNRFRMQE